MVSRFKNYVTEKLSDFMRAGPPGERAPPAQQHSTYNRPHLAQNKTFGISVSPSLQVVS